MDSIGLQHKDSGGRSGETAQRRNGKDELQEDNGGVLQIRENRVLTEDPHQGLGIWIYAEDHIIAEDRAGM